MAACRLSPDPYGVPTVHVHPSTFPKVLAQPVTAQPKSDTVGADAPWQLSKSMVKRRPALNRAVRCSTARTA